MPVARTGDPAHITSSPISSLSLESAPSGITPTTAAIPVCEKSPRRTSPAGMLPDAETETMEVYATIFWGSVVPAKISDTAAGPGANAPLSTAATRTSVPSFETPLTANMRGPVGSANAASTGNVFGGPNSNIPPASDDAGSAADAAYDVMSVDPSGSWSVRGEGPGVKEPSLGARICMTAPSSRTDTTRFSSGDTPSAPGGNTSPLAATRSTSSASSSLRSSGAGGAAVAYRTCTGARPGSETSTVPGPGGKASIGARTRSVPRCISATVNHKASPEVGARSRRGREAASGVTLEGNVGYLTPCGALTRSTICPEACVAARETDS
mmetsp:Transcript_27219/g.64431  ORF Transcript_27219/g.64431 Transcript_27219/m.64431 type:complete len:326 (+) Transcript_27219:425-1402(+)